MKLNNFFLIFLLSLSLLSCFSEQIPEKYRKSEANLNRVIKKTILKLSKKYNMSLSGRGGGTDDEGIWLVDLIFHRRGIPYTMEESRVIIVNCVEELLFDINQDIELRPYLKVYPFTPKNISFAIISDQEDGNSIVHPDLDLVAEYGGEIRYTSTDPLDSYREIIDIYEPYEEAIAKVKKGDASNLDMSIPSKPNRIE